MEAVFKMTIQLPDARLLATDSFLRFEKLRVYLGQLGFIGDFHLVEIVVCRCDSAVQAQQFLLIFLSLQLSATGFVVGESVNRGRQGSFCFHESEPTLIQIALSFVAQSEQFLDAGFFCFLQLECSL